uniref:Methyltransferase domain-containing protein n=1 Tax=Panagrolaimus sp. JU765 TaxID=591449 RepID=A0AC34RNB1_9BILA
MYSMRVLLLFSVLGTLWIVLCVVYSQLFGRNNFNEENRNIIKNIEKTISQIKDMDPKTIEYFQDQAKNRKIALNDVPMTEDYLVLYNVLVPEIYCTDLTRVGRVTDGGKWMCNPLRVKNMDKCTVYSLGISNEPSFEVDFQNFTGHKCLVRSVDKDDQTPETMKNIENANGVFKKAKISSLSDIKNHSYKFTDILKYFNDTVIDILKIDIEGYEFEIKDELFSVPICQILIEIHGGPALKTLQLLQEFSAHDYYLFSYEINGRYHTGAEYGFLHKSCFDKFGVQTILGRYLS